MGLGQTMLTSAFLVLLTIAVMSANKMMVDQDYNFYEQEAFKQASVLGNNMLGEISRKRFDELVDTSLAVYLPVTGFSTSLGPDGTIWDFVFLNGEYRTFSSTTTLLDRNTSIPYASLMYFDDVDDYNGYSRRANTRLFTGVVASENAFTISVRVFYVSPASPDAPSSSRTYLKKVVASVTHPVYLRDTLQLSTVIAY